MVRPAERPSSADERVTSLWGLPGGGYSIQSPLARSRRSGLFSCARGGGGARAGRGRGTSGRQNCAFFRRDVCRPPGVGAPARRRPRPAGRRVDEGTRRWAESIGGHEVGRSRNQSWGREWSVTIVVPTGRLPVRTRRGSGAGWAMHCLPAGCNAPGISRSGCRSSKAATVGSIIGSNIGPPTRKSANHGSHKVVSSVSCCARPPLH